jgi:hypothetical protein|tara:strand:- start:1427 stop:1669 length:243 start_codon:yes stop_codon:yes gene_type:complete
MAKDKKFERKTHLINAQGKKITAAFPSWLPVNPPQWVLVDQTGTFLRDADGHSVYFHTDDEALEYLKKKNIPLLKPNRGY